MNAKISSFDSFGILFPDEKDKGNLVPRRDVRFRDISLATPYERDIRRVVSLGFMTGTSAKKFSPAALLTCITAVQTLYRLTFVPDLADKKTCKALRKNSDADEALGWAAKWGIISGGRENPFCSDDYITKDQLALLFYKYALLRGYDIPWTVSLCGSDDREENQCQRKAAMEWALAVRLFTDKNPITLAAMCRMTRGEFASVILRFYDLYHN